MKIGPHFDCHHVIVTHLNVLYLPEITRFSESQHVNLSQSQPQMLVSLSLHDLVGSGRMLEFHRLYRVTLRFDDLPGLIQTGDQ